MSAPALRNEAPRERPAESALQQREWQFRRLLERLPAGAYTCDAEGLITYFNPHAVQIWGRTPKLNDPVDRFCGSFKLYSKDGTPIAHSDCWMALALQTGKDYNAQEIVIERPDGERITALAHASPIRDESGNLLAAVNVLVDITDRKHSEDALREADRAKNEFLATLAHELRNPLAPIRNAVEVLLLQGPQPEMKGMLDVIERQTRQMTRLIDDLLDLARISSNKLELCKARIELAEVLHTAAETSRPMIAACGQELIVTVPAAPLALDGDLTRLAQVISNLLNNAAKYTARDGRIWLRAERQGSEAVITVQDTGIGIPADMLPRIFGMFTQVDRSLNRAQGGLGIGLTLSRRLVELHDGTITAHSDGAGQGSEFVVRLPAAAAPAPTPRPPSRGRLAALPELSLRILVVDDNEDSAESLGTLLELMGNDVRIAHDGVEAVAAAEEFRPEVVLLDIGLPKMDGYDAAQAIRAQPWGKEMVLIAATGWGQESDRRRSHEAGFDHHMVKPVDLSTLLQLLEKAAAKRSA